MSFTSWLRKLKSSWNSVNHTSIAHRLKSRSSKTAPFQLGLEALEDRCLMTYTPVDLGVFPGTGLVSSAAYAINASHQVVGGDGGRAFLWENGRLTDLGSLGGTSSSALDINDAGQVAGWSRTAAGALHAFRWDNGVMTDLGFVNQGSPEYEQPVVALNNAGTVVGYSYDYSQSVHKSFVWENGALLDLAALLPENSGWTNLHATSVNDAGQIAGAGTRNGQLYPFLYKDTDGDGKFATGGGQIVSLLTKGSNLTLATAINRSGQVTGFTKGSNGDVLAFLWTPSQPNGMSGASKNLGTLPGKYTTSSRAFGLNDAGDVVGKTLPEAGHAVIWPGGGQVQDLNGQITTISGHPYLETAYAISNDGWIVGAADVNFHDAFLLIPGANAVPLLTIGDVNVDEGDAGMTTANFTVTLSRPVSATVTVDYSTSSLGLSPQATPDSDYLAAAGTLTFQPGQTTMTISVPVIGDTLPEDNYEEFVVNLSNPTNALCGDAQATGRINGGDGRLWINTVSLAEGNTGATAFVFTVTLSKATSVPLEVGFTTMDGSAKAGTDFVATSGTLTFAPGDTTKSITVQVTGDTVYEPDETFSVRLSKTSTYSPYVIFTNFSGTGTIRNDDPNPSPGGGKKLTAETAATNPTSSVLSQSDAQSLLGAALVRWQAAGVDTSGLKNMQVRVTDLGGNTLSEVKGNTIWLDDNAAGWGWFVDPTPWDDSEFTLFGDQGEQNHMDLLTALEHEIGHLLGYDHADSGVMDATLAAGQRKTI